ncbi:unnamed protein product [Urochloa humidicola]
MAAVAGTALVRERAVEVKHLCDHARGLLRGVAAHLALLMRVADARGGRAGVELFDATSSTGRGGFRTGFGYPNQQYRERRSILLDLRKSEEKAGRRESS